MLLELVFSLGAPLCDYEASWAYATMYARRDGRTYEEVVSHTRLVFNPTLKERARSGIDAAFEYSISVVPEAVREEVLLHCIHGDLHAEEPYRDIWRG